MKRKWLLILITGIMIFALAACAKADAPPAPTEQSQSAADQSADTDQEDSVDADIATEVPDEGAAQIDAAAIYAQRCASCHGANREGRNGPALLPNRLTKDPAVYKTTITDGSGPETRLIKIR
jgi:mono/diheme cytochrome c family protein